MLVSLCEFCANVREVRTARSLFLLCELARADAQYPKYPPQPVERCGGYQRKAEAKPDAPPVSPGQDA